MPRVSSSRRSSRSNGSSNLNKMYCQSNIVVPFKYVNKTMYFAVRYVMNKIAYMVTVMNMLVEVQYTMDNWIAY